MFLENFLSNLLSSLVVAIILVVLGVSGYQVYKNIIIKKTNIKVEQKNIKQINKDGGQNIVQQNIIFNVYQKSDSQEPVRISSTESTVTGSVPEIIFPEKKLPQE